MNFIPHNKNTIRHYQDWCGFFRTVRFCLPPKNRTREVITVLFKNYIVTSMCFNKMCDLFRNRMHSKTPINFHMQFNFKLLKNRFEVCYYEKDFYTECLIRIIFKYLCRRNKFRIKLKCHLRI